MPTSRRKADPATPPRKRSTRVPDSAIAAVRRFNRFYTAKLRLLDRSHLGSPHTLTEVRVIWELAHRKEMLAGDLARVLAVDPAQLSRLVAGLERSGLVRRGTGSDRRQRPLVLSAAGRRAFASLNAKASREVADVLGPLAPSDRDELLDCLAGAQAILTPASSGDREARVQLRDPLPGDLGWIVERHGAVYHAEYGWGHEFEALVAQIIGEFRTSPHKARERAWIATVDGRRAGSILLVRKDDRVAKLRLLLVEPWARGFGIGGKLVRACIEGAEALGYSRMTLWTNDVLHAARRIYEREGFELVDAKPHSDFGDGLVGQTWERPLTPRGR